MTQHWQDPQAYRYTGTLSADQWAWEFLRRNTEYRQDWQWFEPLWLQLEADYGKPPHRDMARWKQDARAWRSEAELHGCQAICEKRGDDLLIECWMGTKWGFFKFPLDPGRDALDVADSLTWRAITGSVDVLTAEDRPDLDSELSATLTFDLSLPLKDQLEDAKRFLVASQRKLRKAGKLDATTISGSRDRWQQALRVLDARDQGATDADIVDCVFAGDSNAFARIAAEADALAGGDYRRILLMPPA
ncbi:MAG: DUF2285 domain-containing protein [Gammaproteobacteria bacterium]|nr:DUF2285 domain-containing protein [Gammaproteobacteria bacterium]